MITLYHRKNQLKIEVEPFYFILKGPMLQSMLQYSQNTFKCAFQKESDCVSFHIFDTVLTICKTAKLQASYGVQINEDIVHSVDFSCL